MDRAAELKHRLTDPTAVCAALGLAKRARSQPSGIIVRCPWHEDRTPSCSVRVTKDGTIGVRCFACDATGDVFSLVAAVRGLDLRSQFPEVLDAAGAIVGEHRLHAPARRRKPRLSVLEWADDERLSALAEDLRRSWPLDSQHDVLAYVVHRGLLVPAARAGLFALPPLRQQRKLLERLDGEYGRQCLTRAGLIRGDGDAGYALARLRYPQWRLGIPWRRPDGLVQTIQRRFVGLQCPASKYVFPMGGGPRWPFGAELLRASSPGADIMLCEGALDALALRLIARRDHLDIVALGLPSASTWRTEWGELVRDRPVKLALDADSAGEAAILRIAAILHDCGAASVARVAPAIGKDWCDALAAGCGGAP